MFDANLAHSGVFNYEFDLETMYMYINMYIDITAFSHLGIKAMSTIKHV